MQIFRLCTPKQFETISRLFVDIVRRHHRCVLFAPAPARVLPAEGRVFGVLGRLYQPDVLDGCAEYVQLFNSPLPAGPGTKRALSYLYRRPLPGTAPAAPS